MFRLQVQENKKTIEERDEISKELTRVHKQLKNETLYLRTMAARKSIHESYLEQKTKISDIEQKMEQQEADWQEMLKVQEGRDSEIKQLEGDLARARERIEELN